MNTSSKSDETNRMLPKSLASNVISVKAPAKINLYFDILSKRADNYHEILTLFQALDLQDILTFEFDTKDNSPTRTIETNKVEIVLLKNSDSIEQTLFPLDRNNSISQAIQIFLSALSNRPVVDIKVKVEKNIPIGAGLAGGSTDAAATLVALNHYFDKPFTPDKLIQLASEVGSDVSFCLLGGLAVGRGRGEQLEKLIESPQYHLVLVKPRSISVSTPWAYRMYDQFIESENSDEIQPHSISDILLALRFESDIEKHAQLFWNCFEAVIFKEYSILREIKNYLLKLGCISAHLTGSGPTIYGLVKNEKDGKRILQDIKGKSIKNSHAGDDQGNEEIMLDAWLTKSIDKGAQVENDH